jgi:hypothetical protein
MELAQEWVHYLALSVSMISLWVLFWLFIKFLMQGVFRTDKIRLFRVNFWSHI